MLFKLHQLRGNLIYNPGASSTADAILECSAEGVRPRSDNLWRFSNPINWTYSVFTFLGKLSLRVANKVLNIFLRWWLGDVWHHPMFAFYHSAFEPSRIAIHRLEVFLLLTIKRVQVSKRDWSCTIVAASAYVSISSFSSERVRGWLFVINGLEFIVRWPKTRSLPTSP